MFLSTKLGLGDGEDWQPLKGLVYGNSTVFHFAHTSEARGLMDFADFFWDFGGPENRNNPHLFGARSFFEH